MTNPEAPNFSLVWYEVFALGLAAAILGAFPATHLWGQFLAFTAFGEFLGAEQAARDVAPGFAGTMTHFDYLKIGNNWVRALVGVGLSVLIWWLINRWFGYLFLLWLPYHLSGHGAGPMDRLFRWLGHRIGIEIRTY